MVYGLCQRLQDSLRPQNPFSLQEVEEDILSAQEVLCDARSSVRVGETPRSHVTDRTGIRCSESGHKLCFFLSKRLIKTDLRVCFRYGEKLRASFTNIATAASSAPLPNRK